jgi:cytoskeleton protein RodZ
MNEPVACVGEELPIADDLAAQISAGKMLRAARLAQGLHIAALAVSLKVPVRKLEALEADQFDLLPDTVFVRALAASVCRTLKIDPVPVLDRLPYSNAPHLKADESGINVAFRAAGNGAGMSFRDQISKPAMLAVLLLIIGVVVLLFFPVTPATKLAQTPKSQFNAGSMPLSEAASAPAIVENPLVAEGLTTTPAANLALASSEVLLTAKPMTPTSSAPLFGQASALVSVAPTGSAATSGLLVIKARGPSWVEVVDANKVVQIRKTLSSGEVVAASGVTPLSVVVGRADSIEVHVRGKPFDLNGFAKDNVARFQVR